MDLTEYKQAFAIIFLIVLGLAGIILWILNRFFACPHCGHIGKARITYDMGDPHPIATCRKCGKSYYSWD